MEKENLHIVPLFILATPKGIFYCLSMMAVYSIIERDYPEYLRSRKLRVGKKEIGQVRRIPLNKGEITLYIEPMYKKVVGRVPKTQKDTQK